MTGPVQTSLEKTGPRPPVLSECQSDSSGDNIHELAAAEQGLYYVGTLFISIYIFICVAWAPAFCGLVCVWSSDSEEVVYTTIVRSSRPLVTTIFDTPLGSRAMLKTIVITSSFMLLLAYLLYFPIPEEIEEPWKTRILLAALKMNGFIVKTAAFFGFDFIEVNRATLPVVFRAFGRNMHNESSVSVSNTNFNGVDVRIYTPVDPMVKPMSGFVYLHGGGFHIFDAGKYRLSPEHLFPAAVEDCIAVTEYFVTHASDFDVNRGKIGVGGDSAGGNLAAVVSQHFANDKNTNIKLHFQALIYPMLQAFDFRLPSFILNDGILSPVLHTENIVASYLIYWRGKEALKYLPQFVANNHTTAKLKQSKYANYLNIDSLPTEIKNNIPDDFEESLNEGDKIICKEFETTLLNPVFSPLLADDFSNLPPTFLLIGGYDVLRDDALLYAARLKEAGVPTRTMRRDDGYHAMFSFTRLGIGQEALRDVVHFLKSHH
ncbi:hypothetical protein FSP39_024568 [Pinctada imbricata]|uniref:Alpha/beta hydrolase fold-3 domain-containing protein n=1 Tax=Pinctada imbricata TaxID=66713 RepID=A0AA88Y0W6_PINIB|nr:hypothetical protein FSP39_024568 [Pinctada imbricata]